MANRPGKFEGCSDQDAGESLHEMCGNGPDDEAGSVQENGVWYGLLCETGIKGAENVICSEDDYGFFDYTVFKTERAARQAFAEIQAELSESEDAS